MRKPLSFFATLSLCALAPTIAMACGNAMLVHNYIPSTIIWVATMPIAFVFIKLLDRIKPHSVRLQTALLVGFATVPNLLWWSLGQDPKLILFGFNILAGLGLAGYALLFIHIMRPRHTAEETLVSAPFKTDFKIFAGTILFAIGLGALLQALEPQGPETTWEGGFNDAGESVYTNVTF